MKSYRRRFQLPWVTEKRFIGNWDFRLRPLLECNIDFKGKSILDAGCNVGVIDYEISKFGPSFIHGIDNYRAGIYAARNIFAGVEVPAGSRYWTWPMTGGFAGLSSRPMTSSCSCRSGNTSAANWEAG